MEEGRFKRGRGAAAAPWFRVGERRQEITRRPSRINERFSSFQFRADSRFKRKDLRYAGLPSFFFDLPSFVGVSARRRAV
jgi:hypothetical protein